MKKFDFWGYLSVGLILILGLFLISSCSDETTVTPPPAVEIDPTATSGLPGTDVSATVTLTASGGLDELTILKNGGLFDTEIYSGEKDATYDFDYVIEELPVGSVTNFSFQVVDLNGRYSNLGSIAVTVTSKEVVTVSGIISTNTTWTADKIYLLDGFVRVGDDAKRSGGTTITNVTLTIEPGTIVMGKSSSKGGLIIHRGNKIQAVGTAADPIVFTSEKAAGSRSPGNWSGLVIVGRATNNQGANVELEGAYGAFHGVGDVPIASPDEDNSGELKYVRIEYAGNPINPNQEVNSLTLGSVGSGTKISYVQCSYGLDDAFEWFGGKVDAKYLIAYRGLDDDFDVDFGYTGNVQWALGIRDNGNADVSGSNGFEVDNDATGSTATPYTAPVFANVTIVGPKKTFDLNIQDNFQNGMHLRRNTKIKIYNAVVTGYPNGVFIDGSTTIANATANDLQLRNIILAGVDNWGGNGYGSAATTKEQEAYTAFGTNTQNPQAPRGFIFAATANINAVAAQDWFLTGSFANVLEDKWSDVGLNGNYFDIGTPTLLPTVGTGTSLLSKTNLWNNCPDAGTFFDKNVNYIGAFGASDWSTGWANWTPQTTVYQ
jgi:hypothetical protein